MTVSLDLIGRDDVDAHWDVLEPFVVRALTGIEDEMWPCDVRDEAIAGRMMLFLISVKGEPKGVVVTSVKVTPRISYLYIDMLGGFDMSEWMTYALNSVKVVAEGLGLPKVKALGRDGWRRFADDNGFKMKRTLFELEI